MKLDLAIQFVILFVFILAGTLALMYWHNRRTR